MTDDKPSDVEITFGANYEKLDEIAKILLNRAEELKAYSQRLQAMIEIMPDGWKGEAAEKFLTLMEDDILPPLHRLGDALESASITTDDISASVGDAEEQARNTFMRGGASSNRQSGSQTERNLDSGGTSPTRGWYRHLTGDLKPLERADSYLSQQLNERVADITPSMQSSEPAFESVIEADMNVTQMINEIGTQISIKDNLQQITLDAVQADRSVTSLIQQHGKDAILDAIEPSNRGDWSIAQVAKLIVNLNS